MIQSILYKISKLKEDEKQTNSNEKIVIQTEIVNETKGLDIQTNKDWQLSDIFRDAKGVASPTWVQLRKLKVFTEKKKFLEQTRDIAKFDKSVLCDDNVARS